MKKFVSKLKKNFFVNLLIKLWQHPKGRLGLILVGQIGVDGMRDDQGQVGN